MEFNTQLHWIPIGIINKFFNKCCIQCNFFMDITLDVNGCDKSTTILKIIYSVSLNPSNSHLMLFSNQASHLNLTLYFLRINT